MALSTFKGTFAAETTGTTPIDQSVTGVGFVPKAIIMWADAQTAAGTSADLQFSMGFSDGTTDFCVGETSEDNVADSNTGRMNSSKVISLYSVTPALLVECDLKSFDADGFTVTWTTNDTTAYLIHFFCIGGADLTAVDCNYFATATATGLQSVTGVGFRPDCLLFLGTIITGAPPNTVAGNASISIGAALNSNQRLAEASYSEDGQGVADAAKQRFSLACMQFLGNKGGNPSNFGRADFDVQDSDGFTVDWVNVPNGAYTMGFLALKGGSYYIAQTNSQRTDEGDTQALTGVGFTPTGAMFFSTASPDASLADHQGVGIGAASAAGVEGWLSALDRDPTVTMKANTRSLTDKCISLEIDPDEPLGVDAEADLTSFDSDGMTLTWTTKFASPIQYSFLCMGNKPVGAAMPRGYGQVIG